MQIIDNSQLPRAALPGIEHMTLASRASGLQHLSIWRQSVAPGAATPPHSHDCEEVVLICSGSGEVRLAGGVRRFGPGSTLVIPPHELHEIVNTGEGPLELIGVFSATPVGVYAPTGAPIELPWAS